jgi:hypothetical protein
MIPGSICITCLICFCFYTTLAQENTQMWLDYQVDYPFSNQYLLEVEASYQRLLTHDSTWRSINLTPTFEYQFFPNLDLVGSAPLSYTAQTKDYDSFESRITLEARWHVTQNKRVNTRLVFKAEKRFFQNLEDNSWDNSTRMRIKAEATISINGPNLYQDKLFYAIVDYEEFIVMDQQLNERYANKRRARLGTGYRLDYKNRFEIIYTLQTSRNELEEEFTSIDNVVQFRYKMFLNPAKVKPTTQN